MIEEDLAGIGADPDDRVGHLFVTTHYDDDGQVADQHIDRADPIIWAAAELIDLLRTRDNHPDGEINGDLLTVRGSNRTVIYRIGEYDPQRQAYLCHWPD